MDVFRLFTKRNLSVNKTRTIVTVVGIILAVSMFTATTEAFVTIQKNLVEYAEINSGKYHVGFYDIQSEDFSVVTEDKRVEAFTYVQDVGYAEIGSSNEYKPYLFIGAIPGDYTEIMPMNMISGRLP